jgi:FtsZ-interacting cell division protein ZipA
MMMIVAVVGAFAFVALTITGLWRQGSVYTLTSSP